jgi:hypothetical protein
LSHRSPCFPKRCSSFTMLLTSSRSSSSLNTATGSGVARAQVGIEHVDSLVSTGTGAVDKPASYGVLLKHFGDGELAIPFSDSWNKCRVTPHRVSVLQSQSTEGVV